MPKNDPVGEQPPINSPCRPSACHRRRRGFSSIGSLSNTRESAQLRVCLCKRLVCLAPQRSSKDLSVTFQRRFVNKSNMRRSSSFTMCQNRLMQDCLSQPEHDRFDCQVAMRCAQTCLLPSKKQSVRPWVRTRQLIVLFQVKSGTQFCVRTYVSHAASG
jgi:hypothetical protein